MKEALLSGLERIGRVPAGFSADQRFARAVASLRAPAQRWNLTRRLMACVALAAFAFALAAYACRALDLNGRATSTAAIDALEQRLREGRARIARLPQMRRSFDSGRQASAESIGRTSGREWRAVADLASRTDVTLRTLEPAPEAVMPTSGRGKAAQRALRMDGRADFVSLHAFLQGLSTLPMLVVPAALSVKRESDALSFATTLDVFDALPAHPAPTTYGQAASGAAVGDQRRSSIDPFGIARASAQGGASTARLAGFVLDELHSLALFEGGGVPAAVVEPGQTLGAERVVQIDVHGVTLAGRDGARRAVLPEDAR